MPHVYVHYCVDPHGITQVLFSGHSDKRGSNMDKNIFNAAVTAIKTIPSGKRRYDPDTKIWYVDNEYWNQIREFYIKGSAVYTLVPYSDEDSFEAMLTGSPKIKADWTSAAENVAAKAFFNNFNSAVEKAADNKSDKQTLAELLGLTAFEQIPSDVTVAKKLYRNAALRLHPDKNNGDGSKMSTLNELWREYVSLSSM